MTAPSWRRSRCPQLCRGIPPARGTRASSASGVDRGPDRIHAPLWRRPARPQRGLTVSAAPPAPAPAATSPPSPAPSPPRAPQRGFEHPPAQPTSESRIRAVPSQPEPRLPSVAAFAPATEFASPSRKAALPVRAGLLLRSVKRPHRARSPPLSWPMRRPPPATPRLQHVPCLQQPRMQREPRGLSGVPQAQRCLMLQAALLLSGVGAFSTSSLLPLPPLLLPLQPWTLYGLLCSASQPLIPGLK
mmetsp:Transcript_39953/g.106891  ORF Transcript_39953/g.106891 Transcript_39953/m.106891 type:complete len:245 (+) Transcript_39953:618-1352(+)